MKVTRKISVCGLVQGIGFRPFVHRVAHRFNLPGEVWNNEKGVQILITGEQRVIDAFYHELLHYPYELARIRRIKIEPVSLKHFSDFRIVPTKKGQAVNMPFTPDLALCQRCAAELRNPDDRRYHYPFTACVECGQRWSVSEQYPFEREHTSYKDRKPCSSCTREYTRFTDRRYHAQTISCPDCGFHCWLEENGSPLSVPGADIFAVAAAYLNAGKILALKNTAGFLLCCDASDRKAIELLRTRKHRPDKPLAVLFPDLEQIRAVAHCSLQEAEALTGKVSPIVVLSLKSEPEMALAVNSLAPGLDQLGAMLPYNGILMLLAEAFGKPLVATSGNLHTKPVIAHNEEAREQLKEVADVFLLHDQMIINAQDDSVVKFSPIYRQPIILRRSRGMAPNYFDAPCSTEKQLLAMGGELKSTIGLIPNNYLYISQYLGTLGSLETYDRYLEVLERFQVMFNLKPELIVTDLHPGYQSTLLGKEIAGIKGIVLKQVQHHEAHFAAILAEHHLFDHPGPILGVIWDGTGYGSDGQVWGGEFMKYQDHQINRESHLGYFPWIAGDKMAREPRISLLSALCNSPLWPEVKEKFSSGELRVYQKLCEKEPLQTSSVGRLFDAAASLLGLCDHNNYEGQAAMLLEAAAGKAPAHSTEGWEVFSDQDLLISDQLLTAMYTALQQGIEVEVVALGFLKTLVKLIFKEAGRMKVQVIALSGGVFQNALLTDLVKSQAGTRYKVCIHRELSPNDENIAFGQLMHVLNCKEI